MLDRRAEVIRLLSLAQGGAAEEALRSADAEVAALDGLDPHLVEALWLPGLHYVRGTALHSLGDHAAAARVAEDLVSAAQRVGSGAWVLVGRLFGLLQASLVEPTVDPSTSGALLERLATVEAELPDVEGEPLGTVSAYTNMGRCYLVLRLYELAGPHFEHAQRVIAAHPEQLHVSGVTTQLNLSLLHADWATELRRVGRLGEAAEHEQSARGYAARAADGPEDDALRAYRAKAALMVACMSVDDGDPDAAATRIRASATALRGSGQRSDESFALMYESRALARAGRPAEAMEAVRRACAALPTDAQPALTAAVLHSRASLTAQAVSDGEILAYGDYLALVLAGQRERTLELARSLRVLERLARERERIQRLAYTDALTGVGNRHTLDRFVGELRTRPASRLAVAVVDVDDLKIINDVRGHDAGDEILRVIAIVLTGRAGSPELVMRLGGDEFVLLDCEPELPDPDRLAGDITAAVDTALHGLASVSVGVAVGGSEEVRGLLRRADRAMYASKRRGRSARATATMPERVPAPAR